MDSNSRITQAVKVQMVRMGLTQKSLAGNSHVDPTQLNRYFVGAREWPIRILDMIAPALGWKDGLDIFNAAQKEKAPAATDDKAK